MTDTPRRSDTTAPIDILAVACDRRLNAHTRLECIKMTPVGVVSDLEMQMAVIAYAAANEDVVTATRIAVELQEHQNAIVPF